MRQPALIAFLLLLLFPAVAVAQRSDNRNDDEILIRINGSDTVEAGESVDVAVIVDGDLELAGQVNDAAVVVDGDLSVLNGAEIDGNLVAIDGTVTLRDGSRVTGDIYLSNDSSWIREEGATFTGEVHQGNLTDLDREIAWQIVIGSIAGWFGATLIAIAVAFVFSGVGGKQLWSSAGNLTTRPGATVLTALAFWFGISLLVIPVILSVVAILALPLIAMVAVAIWSLGFITFGTRLGATLTGQNISDTEVAHPYLASIAGAVILQLLGLIAVGCALGAGLIAWFGDGRAGLSLLLGIPAVLLYVILFLVGVLGGGALVLRAMSAWSSRF